MDFDEYRKRGKEMVDYIADYLENIRDRRVLPNVKPGYMRNLLPDSAPIEGEDWDKIFNDVERVIMPGVTHWQSPHMHAYFPALNSFPSLLGDMLADAINCLGFTWASSPACTELETIVMNWLGKMIGLPDEFLHTGGNSKGGGVIQTTASEATLVCLLAGRTLAIKRYHEKTPGYQDAEINARLVAYCSDQAHSSVEKAALIGLVRMRYIESDANLSQRGSQLCDAIESDIKEGLIPFWVCATLGTTGACAFDNLVEVGNVCRKYNLWLHVDAAYAGSAFICPEYRIWLKGIEKADSIAFNPSKWLMVHFDCTAMWVKDSTAVHRTFNVEPLYLQHENSGLAIDYMHWQIPLSKRFRALKLWFVLRSYGIKGLQQHIREGVRLAQKFEALVLGDFRFEIPAVRHLGMVVFRIKGENDLTERLLKRLNHRGNLHCVPASLKGKYVIRFTVTSTRTTSEDILSDWAEIREVTTELLEELDVNLSDRAKVSLKDTREKNEAFGSSLLLANTPMSPKIVNGSFAAIFDTGEFLEKAYAGIRIAHQDSPSMRRRVRGILMSGKQFSLDSRMDLVVHSCLDSEQQGGNNNDNRTASIREDSEDLWEAYENLGTPPRTPSPLVSPLHPSTPSRMKHKTYNSAPFLQVPRAWKSLDVNPDRDRVRNNNPPNISTARNKARTVDSFISVQQMDKVVSFSRCRDSQCASSSNLIAGRGQPRRKKFHDQNQQPVATLRQNNVTEQHPDRNRTSEAAKRYAYAAKSPSSHSFYNRGFRAVPHPKRREFQNNVYATGSMPDIAEFCFEDEVDWKGLRNLCDDKDTKRPPKIRVRVQDETGHRVRTAFDASSDESSPTARNEMNKSLLQYLDCEEKIVRKQTRSSDERTTCCKKCGHHRTVAQAS